MNSHRVDVFHIADRYAVVEAVADHFILDLFPSAEIFFDEYLRNAHKGARSKLETLGFVSDDPGPFPAQRKCRPKHHRKSDLKRGFHRILRALHGEAASALHSDLIERVREKFTILG